MNKVKYVVTIEYQGIDTLDSYDIEGLLEYAIKKTKSKDFSDGVIKVSAETIEYQWE
ncbi:MAG: hypothetical protein ACRDD7_15590 [Peptostreptococcaceae bacterium]